MKKHQRIFPVTTHFINELRSVIRKHYNPTFEKNLSDKEVLELSEQVQLNAYLKEVFKDGDTLENNVIEY
jgi:hypothetical protein